MSQVTITTQACVEKVGNKNFACYTTDKIENCALAGYGETPQEAIDDMNLTYEEIKEINAEDGLETPKLAFTYKFDIPSLLAYINCINVTKLSQLIGINPSLMRQYATNKANASDAQLAKINEGLNKLRDLLALTAV